METVTWGMSSLEGLTPQAALVGVDPIATDESSVELYTSKRDKTEWDFILIYTHKLKTASSVFTELIGRAFNLISGHDSSPKDVCDELIWQGTVSDILSMSQEEYTALLIKANSMRNK